MPIIRYHAVTPRATYCTRKIAVTPERFDQHLAFLAANYRVISIDDVVRSIATNSPFPPRAVCITFDDGYLDNYEYAFPLLKKYGMAATFYVVAGPVVRGERFWIGWLHDAVAHASDLAPLRQAFGIAERYIEGATTSRELLIDQIIAIVNRGDRETRTAVLADVEVALGGQRSIAPEFMMRPEHLREMARSGMTIGSHSLSHPILASLSEREARDEMRLSKNLLEEALDAPVEHLAYPNGPGISRHFTADTMRIASQIGYRSASSSTRGVVRLTSHPFALERQGVSQLLDRPGFAFKLEEHRFRFLLDTREH
jgi:peptidoglycan/xylan/chitin deacetylase (PgdA/CDA1 family)